LDQSTRTTTYTSSNISTVSFDQFTASSPNTSATAKYECDEIITSLSLCETDVNIIDLSTVINVHANATSGDRESVNLTQSINSASDHSYSSGEKERAVGKKQKNKVSSAVEKLNSAVNREAVIESSNEINVSDEELAVLRQCVCSEKFEIQTFVNKLMNILPLNNAVVQFITEATKKQSVSLRNRKLGYVSITYVDFVL
jgi:hypothetical protein